MKKVFYSIFSIIILAVSCDDSETITQDLYGTLAGQIYLINEVGIPLSDNDSILVQLGNKESSFSVYTDSSGYYEITDIPTGTYNLTYYKEGFSEYSQKGFPVLGGDDPVYDIKYIGEIPKTTIKNLSAEYTFDEQNKRIIKLNGLVYFDIDSTDIKRLAGTCMGGNLLPIYINTYSSAGLEDSCLIFKRGMYFLLNNGSGSDLDFEVPLYTKDSLANFDKIFIVAYAVNSSSLCTNINFITSEEILNSDGAYSNVVTMDLP